MPRASSSECTTSCFIADNVLAVTGGRNLGDAYFGNDKNANFIDLDVLVAGRIVQDLSRSFDAYWNNDRAYPVESLVKRDELDKIREQARAADKAERERAASGAAQPDANGAAPSAEQRAHAWDEKPMELRDATFVWAPAVVLVDKPGKITLDGASGGTADAPNEARGLVVTGKAARSSGAPANSSIEAAANAAEYGDTVVEGLLQLIGLARRDLLIISPYFVPGPDMLQAFAAARTRGVTIRVLTNSLASNDAPVAHVGYARPSRGTTRHGRRAPRELR